MKVTKFDIPGLLLLENKVFPDERGFFTERFRVDQFREFGITASFTQENYSLSKPGALRGLHFQFAPPQGKLVTCVTGSIFDVAVDIRKDSPTFGRHLSIELHGAAPRWLWIPAGFAHGFCVLGNEPAGVLYKVDCGWGPGGEGGIRFDDPELKIDWPTRSPILSSKDLVLGTFADYARAPRF